MNLLAHPGGGLFFLCPAGEGMVFAMVRLVKRRMTGLVAGMARPYGNVGVVTFLTVLSFDSPQIFFITSAGAALVIIVADALLLEEPKGHTAEVLPDDTEKMIEVE